jgi:hypothetical protein
MLARSGLRPVSAYSQQGPVGRAYETLSCEGWGLILAPTLHYTPPLRSYNSYTHLNEGAENSELAVRGVRVA